MWRVAITYKNGELEAINKETKEECEEWLLNKIEKKEGKKAIIVNKKDIKQRDIINF